jgi:hypothetical protein
MGDESPEEWVAVPLGPSAVLPQAAAHAPIRAASARIVGELAEPCPLISQAPNGLGFGARRSRTRIPGLCGHPDGQPGRFFKTANFTPFESSFAVVRGD